MNKKIFLLSAGLIVGLLSACATQPVAVETTQAASQVQRPVVLTQPAKLTRIPIFSPPPPSGLAQLRDDTLYLPLQEYIALQKEVRGRKLPYTR